MQNKIPSWIHMLFMVATCLLFVPPLLIMRARYNKTPNPRVHPIPDMDNQKYYRKQAENVVFADGRSMRLPVQGTVALGELRDDDHYFRGRVKSAKGELVFATEFPARVIVDYTLLKRGQQRFEIFCAPCHGPAGFGDGMVHKRAAVVSRATWTDPTSMHAEGKDSPAAQSVGQLFNTITNGIRNMPPHGPQVSVQDRWAIIAYVRALQLSQNASQQ